jgi:HEAT repeat protein
MYKTMIKINTPTKAQDLYELAQEAPYPMAKRALEAIRNGKSEEAVPILEELLDILNDKNVFRLRQYLRELIFRVILWKQLPESEKEGIWLVEIEKYREEIALLLYKNPDLALIFEKKLADATEGALEIAEGYIKNEPIFIPSQEDIFETEHNWEIFKTKSHEK